MMLTARLLNDHALLFLTGTTVLLFVGCALMAVMRSPAHRQRTGELTLAATVAWLALACLPLPRLLPDRFLSERFMAKRLSVTDPSVEQSTAAPLLATDPIYLDGDSDLPSSDVTISPNVDKDAETDLRAQKPMDRQPIGNVQISAQGLSQSDFALPEATAPPRVATIYLVGAVVCMAWFGSGLVRLIRIRRAGRRPPGWLAELFESLVESRGKPPRLLVSMRCPRPMFWGVWRPIIVLPTALARRSHREQVRVVLLHELGHVARRDGWSNLLVCLAYPVLYAHPLFWWLRAQVRLAAELLADDWAAQRAGKLVYVEQLVVLARSSPANITPLAGAVTLYSSPSQFYRRMQMLISRNRPLSTYPSTRWRLASLIVALLVVALAAISDGVRPAAGQQAKSAEEKAPETDAVAPAEKVATVPEAQPAGKTAETVEPANPLQQLPIAGRLFTAAAEATAAPASDAEEQDLRAKLAVALQQIRALEEQLKALGAQRSKGDAKQAAPVGTTTEPKPNIVTLTRVNEDGSISTEGWSTSPDGRPEKILWKKKSHSKAESSIAAARPAELSDGQVVKEYKDKRGQVLTHVYDAATGRLIETRRGNVPADPALPQAEATPAAANPATTAAPALAKPSAAMPRSPSSGVERGAEALDLVNLATAYADAVGAVETAQAGIAVAEEAVANKVGSTRELDIARLALRGAQRKYELLRKIANLAVQNAKDDLERARQLVGSGAASTNVASEAESRWKMLNAILQSGPTDQTREGLGLPGKAP